MCVGLSAKVVKISNGKERFHPSSWRIWNQVITSWSTPELRSQRSQMKMKARPISLWRNCCNGRTKETNSQRDHRKL